MATPHCDQGFPPQPLAGQNQLWTPTLLFQLVSDASDAPRHVPDPHARSGCPLGGTPRQTCGLFVAQDYGPPKPTGRLWEATSHQLVTPFLRDGELAVETVLENSDESAAVARPDPMTETPFCLASVGQPDAQCLSSWLRSHSYGPLFLYAPAREQSIHLGAFPNNRWKELHQDQEPLRPAHPGCGAPFGFRPHGHACWPH